MYLKINNSLLQNDSLYKYIAKNIQNQFVESKEDVDKLLVAKTPEEIETIFNDYYEGWEYNDVKFYYGDIDLILYWMKNEPKTKKIIRHI